MDTGGLLGVQGEDMFGGDYQVFLPDGRPVGQVWVLGCSDGAVAGKPVQLQESIIHKIKANSRSYTLKFSLIALNATGFLHPAGLKCNFARK